MWLWLAIGGLLSSTLAAGPVTPWVGGGPAPTEWRPTEDAVEPAPRAGIDLRLSFIEDTNQATWFGGSGRTGIHPNGRVGLSFATTAQNVGMVPIDWYSTIVPMQPMDPRHPFIGQNMFRLRQGRLEQIGLAWIKHAFSALNDGCTPGLPNTQLGVGCSDTYGSPTNARQDLLGPRSEVNPFTCAWQPCGSYFDTRSVGYTVAGDCMRTVMLFDPEFDDQIIHQMRVSEQDMLNADNDGLDRKLYIEGFYLTPGDQNLLNNWRWRAIEAAPDPQWTFLDEAAGANECMVFAWGELRSFAAPATSGFVVAATRIVDLGGGARRYEYNVYNMNKHGGAVSFSVPVPQSVVVSNIGFWGPVENEDPQFSSANWTSQRTTTAVVFTAPAAAPALYRNSIRYGTMYTFWFQASATPSNGTATLEWDIAGAAGPPLTALLRRPTPVPCVGDVSGDGVVNADDLGFVLGAWLTNAGAPDVTQDGVVNADDLAQVLGQWGPCP